MDRKDKRNPAIGGAKSPEPKKQKQAPKHSNAYTGRGTPIASTNNHPAYPTPTSKAGHTSYKKHQPTHKQNQPYSRYTICPGAIAGGQARCSGSSGYSRPVFTGILCSICATLDAKISLRISSFFQSYNKGKQKLNRLLRQTTSESYYISASYRISFMYGRSENISDWSMEKVALSGQITQADTQIWNRAVFARH